MKTEKFFGASAVAPLEECFMQMIAHESHFLLFNLVDLSFASIRCSSCKVEVVEGSRELVEAIWLEWSMRSSEG